MAYYRRYPSQFIAERDKDYPPAWAWEDSVDITFTLLYIIWPDRAKGQTSKDDYGIVISKIDRDPESFNPHLRVMDAYVKMVGNFPGLTEGARYQGTGKIVFNNKDPKYAEWQVVVEGVFLPDPISKGGVIAHLTNVENIGHIRATAFWDAWGKDTMDVLDRAYESLGGITTESDAELQEEALDNIDPETRRVFRAARLGKGMLVEMLCDHQFKRDDFKIGQILNKAQIKGNTFKEIIRDYRGSNFTEAILHDPAALLEYDDITFKQADAVWKECGLDPRDKRRIAAGIYEVLKGAARDGHCWMPLQEALTEANQVLGIPDVPKIWIRENYEHDKDVQEIVLVDFYGNIWQRRLWAAEETVASRIQTLMAHPGKVSQYHLERIPQYLQQILDDINKKPDKQETVMEEKKPSIEAYLEQIRPELEQQERRTDAGS
jgi:hypothetical protein